jgi:hypothetical protein
MTTPEDESQKPGTIEGPIEPEGKRTPAVKGASEVEATPEADDAESRDTDAVIGSYVRLFSRIGRAVRGLLAAHIIVVRNEVQREILRLLIGIGFTMTAGISFVLSAVLGAVTLVTAVQRITGLPLLESLLICIAVLATSGLLLAFAAWLILRRPLMPQSRELIRTTLDGFAARADS